MIDLQNNPELIQSFLNKFLNNKNKFEFIQTFFDLPVFLKLCELLLTNQYIKEYVFILNSVSYEILNNVNKGIDIPLSVLDKILDCTFLYGDVDKIREQFLESSTTAFKDFCFCFVQLPFENDSVLPHLFQRIAYMKVMKIGFESNLLLYLFKHDKDWGIMMSDLNLLFEKLSECWTVNIQKNNLANIISDIVCFKKNFQNKIDVFLDFILIHISNKEDPIWYDVFDEYGKYKNLQLKKILMQMEDVKFFYTTLSKSYAMQPQNLHFVVLRFFKQTLLIYLPWSIRKILFFGHLKDKNSLLYHLPKDIFKIVLYFSNAIFCRKNFLKKNSTIKFYLSI